MALKRSGVRSSSAPFHSTPSPPFPFHVKIKKNSARTRTNGARWRWRLATLLALASAFALCEPHVRADPASETMDVIVLVNPVAERVARIGVIYRTKVDHRRVSAEIDRLANTIGAHVEAGRSIVDEAGATRLLPRAASTTGATFTLSGAQQVQNGAPKLDSYLTAFQGWDNVEVIFAIDDLQPYRGPVDVHSGDVSVQLIKEPGAYRYEARIMKHTGALPALASLAEAPLPITATSARTRPNNAGPVWPYILIIAGAGLLGGVGTYVLLTRRSGAAPG